VARHDQHVSTSITAEQTSAMPARLPRFVSLPRVVLAAAAICFLSASWQFTRSLGNDLRLVDVSPRHTLLPLVLFVFIAWAGRADPLRACRLIGVAALGIVILTAVVLPFAMNLAIDDGHPFGAWPLDWIVPVQVHVRTS
jgi:hypothetical protein